ncbi:immunoglobulin-like domain-containing protein [Listeria booriae]|uniref:immunoglobulin-like domain-containing protein n=1 Tax=Listeria booriae TaxID=1552123 RepID=UPI00162A2205|nr:immunoglobulin-like domain-containing protein [Listeria booriae]MBC1985164.1 hypothetical protein [Listeria booriae]MBC2048956.1 hypothetical protein [Listeria booriae]
MTKSKLKKIVSSALVANLIIGSVITALPTQGAAVENAATGNSAEKRLVSNLKANQNLLKNTSFASTSTGIADWSAEQNSNDAMLPSVIAYGTKGSDGWFNFASARTSVRPVGDGSIELHGFANSVVGVSQVINTIPGQTYTISYNYNTTRYTTKAFAVGTATFTGFIVNDATSGAEIKNGSISSGGSPGSSYYPNVANRTGSAGTLTGTFVATGKTTKVFIGGNLNSADKTNELYQTISNVQVLGESTAQLAAPTLQPVKNQDPKITGSLTGDIATLKEVQIYKNDSYVGTATVSDHDFEMTVLPSNVGDVYKAYAVDIWDVKSNPAIQTVTASAIATPTINRLTDQSTTASGTGEPGSVLTLKIGDATYTTDVAADGTWSKTITKPKAGLVAEAISVKSGVTSNKATTTVVDVTAPDAPVLSTVTDKDTHVKGTGEAGTTVKIKLPNNTELTGTVDASGKFDVVIPVQVKDAVITATLTDAAGNVSTAGTTTVVHAAPSAPVLDTVTDKSTKVTGTGDIGNTVTIKITDNGVSISYVGTVDDFGEFSIPIDTPKAGATVEAIAKDSTNALSPKTSTIVQDVTAPDAPIVNPVIDTATTITGSGEANCDVKVTLPSGGVLTGRTNDAGTFSIAMPAQTAGREIKVTLTDAAGNESNPTTITVQPSVISAPTINGVTTDDLFVTGTGIKGATVTLTIAGIDYTGTVDNNGNYSIAILKQAVGTVISAKQTSASKTSTSVTTTVTQGTVAAPTINAVTTDDTTVRGTGITGAVVTITIGSNTYTGTVTNGEYAITIPKQAVGTVVSAKQTLNDKTSSSVNTTVTQGSIAAPTINAVTTDSTTVTGTGVVGATVTVTIGSNNYTGTVAANGTYAITIPKQPFGTAITVKQALNNKTSTNANTTVTQGTVAAPTINAVTTDDTTVKGTGIAGATVTVTIGSNNYTGTVAANGAYSITIPKQAAGTVISAKQTLNSKTSSSVNTTVTATQTTLTADSFTVGIDNYIKGTYTGSGVAKLAIEVNGTLQQKITATGSPYQYYAKGKVTAATDQVYVISYNANGDQLKRVKVDVKRPTAGTLTPDTFYIGTDNYVTGTLTGDISKFSLTINGVETTKINVTTAPTFRYYANNLINSLTDIVTVNGYDNAGKLLDSKPVTVSQDRGNPGTIATVAPFKLGKDSYVTGTYTGDIAKVELQVNDTSLQRISVAADGTIKYYAKGKINATTDVVKLVGYNSAGVAVSTKLVTVSNSDGSITANPYVIGTDSYVKGTYTGDVAKISLTVNGDKKTTITVPTPGPNYQYYAKSLITAATDVVVVTAYDATGGVLDTKTVAVSKPAVVTTGTVTPSAYKIGTNTYVDGTYTGDVAKVALEINGVLSASIPATGNTIHYYAGSLITDKNDVVNVIVYDAAGKQLDKKRVTITAPEGTVTPNTLKTTDSYLTGSATGDVAKVVLSVNGVKQASITVVQADGTYRYYVKPLALTPADVVKVIGLDSRGNEITSADVTITN